MERIGSTLLFGGWLMVEKPGLAGIPQRGLLGLIALWVVRALPQQSGTSDHPPHAAIEFRQIPSP